MQKLHAVVILLLLFIKAECFAQNKSVPNPLLVHSNLPIDFKKINARYIREAVASMKQLSDNRVKKITSFPSAKRTETNTLMAADELGYDLADLAMKVNLVSATYVSDSTRNAANLAAGELSMYTNDLYLNEKLYKALKEFSSGAAASGLKPNHKKFLDETILAFEKNGMKLDEQGRKELQGMNEKIVNYGIAFDRNIAEARDSIRFSEEELEGLPNNTKAPWKTREGSYVVRINGPNYTEIMNNANREATRRQIFLKYNNRAYPANITVLDSLFYYRYQAARKLGFRSYAEYAVVDKMAKSPENVWSFEQDLVKKLTPLVTADLNEIRELKRKQASNDTIYEWDLSYYRKKLLDSRYQLNMDEVKEYFEMNNTLKGMFLVYEKLFNLQIKELKGLPVWHEKVKSFEMYKDGARVGRFYLDLFPRPDKYTHFACAPISQYRIVNGKELLPVSALLCNFPEGTSTQPSLLYHADVITLFHEFGHLVHSMLGRSDIASQGPFAVKGDFTEAPSQFLENWVWEYEPIQLFARHYKTGEVLPKSLFDKMKKTQLVSTGINNMRQVYLGILDFTYEDKFDSLNGKDLMDVAINLMPIRQIPYSPDTHFITAFGHLNGYAANYYGYLWSRVFAEDMFSMFKKNGVMDAKTGIRYRKEILEKASSKDEMDMLRTFLGREPNADPFLQSLGIKAL